MTLTLSIGWWAVPAAVSCAALVAWRLHHRNDPPASGYGAPAQAMYQLMTLGVAVIVSLVAWLIWAVLT
jgi:hypothetical protein